MKRLWLGSCACLLLAAACTQGGQPAASVAPFGHLQIAATMHTYRAPFQMGQITSMVQDDSGRLLMCDHSRLFVMTNVGAGYSISELARPQVPVWQPTGLAYRAGLLYVANGPGHDVLVLRLTNAGLVMELRITSPVLVSPQAVVVETDGSMIVADQIGSTVLKFSAEGTLVWQTRLNGAHGVVESGGSIYATSLQDQTISRLTLAGKIVQTVGKAGVSAGRYLRPVGLTASGGQIIVTDAYNGRVTVLDQNLHVVRQVGGTGPGMDAFNFPTATLPVSGGYLIADGYRQRIVHTDTAWVVLNQITMGPMVPTARQRPLIFGATDTQPYTYTMLPGVDVLAALGLRPRAQFVGSFDGIDWVGGGGTPAHLTFDDSQLGGTGATWAQMVGSYIVAGSPTNDRLEVIDPSTGMFTYVVVGNDSWPRSDSLLLADNLRRPLNEVIAPALLAFSRATQLRSQGVSRPDALNQALFPTPRNLTQDLTSPPARQFLQSGMTPNDARQFYAAALQQHTVRIVELLEVKYLSGA